MSRIKLQAEREALEGLTKKHYGIITSLFRCRHSREESKHKVMDYEHRMRVIDWKLRGSTSEPKPLRLGREWLI